MGNISTGIFIAGTAALATGAVLYLRAHPSADENAPDPTALHILPGVAMAPVGLTLLGGF